MINDENNRKSSRNERMPSKESLTPPLFVTSSKNLISKPPLHKSQKRTCVWSVRSHVAGVKVIWDVLWTEEGQTIEGRGSWKGGSFPERERDSETFRITFTQD